MNQHPNKKYRVTVPKKSGKSAHYHINATNKKAARSQIKKKLKLDKLSTNIEIELETENSPVKISLGERAADLVTSMLGSWKFIIVQSCILLVWIVLNCTGPLSQWDPYPFILMNLMLSLQAAYSAPVIMMSQNRQANIDRVGMKKDGIVGRTNLIIDQQTNENVSEILFFLIDYKEELEKRLEHLEKTVRDLSHGKKSPSRKRRSKKINE